MEDKRDDVAFYSFLFDLIFSIQYVFLPTFDYVKNLHLGFYYTNINARFSTIMSGLHLIRFGLIHICDFFHVFNILL